ncbi:MAG: hypothetical protein FJ088_10320, partial [Deltaproteobacteria bacterium]|nr:hypothetical protein [Deltaproteobacteria bacterium]
PESFRNQSKTEPYSVQVGMHTLSCSKNGGPPFVTTFEVAEDSLIHANCKLGEYAAKDKTLGWIAVGGAVVSAGLGTYLLISYYNDKAKADEMGKVLQSNKQYFGPALIGLGVAAGVVSYFLLTGGDEDAVEAGYERFKPGFFASENGVVFSASGRF